MDDQRAYPGGRSPEAVRNRFHHKERLRSHGLSLFFVYRELSGARTKLAAISHIAHGYAGEGIGRGQTPFRNASKTCMLFIIERAREAGMSGEGQEASGEE